ncbi:PQQ-dependent sugar dehydrogenase [Pseudomonas chlororaphis]|uniref:Soluble aldose sugar dehydrogenase YliI n=1 Tax=Pseudomonas chlororaphis TaxID=587753 RepID=A0AAX3FN21_9PSED|nr:PQQ-dependent sugar dehydrogenase [Pseudomonas chlororaphis]AZC37448.1 Soluble aldose sugar dehydrogenase, PQQ-dependent [Pseudomonas chlororaphis subsp. piscium]AZC43997.1 Soluble aldose sugar dehydrogenase, PQQ-dependent [Pseudomonas chlororaphis subsp. piscium]WDG75847.1 PQQ-dependent sugar dehydrogenase [Pseudomonas chlororaphis]WDH26518.1 PQQ-dependent sugar dehydrogenase [Pseudomonas chlororaphis]WDH74365.1 PQQ-dependent sugar dehydrogenase [Pseudomonas chlororaphis]
MLRKTLLATVCASLVLSSALPAVAATRQQLQSEQGPLSLTPVVEGLDHPWALAFLPDRQGILVTERPGNLRLVGADGKLSAPLGGVPQVWAKGQGGLLDVVLSPDFKQDRLVYLSYAEGGGEGGTAGTAVGRGRLSEDLKTLKDFQVIFRQAPKLSTGNHFGSRLVFDRDGYLFITLGENNERPTAQDLDKLQGKIVRLYPDGRVPEDNPFVGQPGVRPEIWSYGHRNPQGAALNPWSGTLWDNEHGPKGGDEINLIERGKNYGWPLATHGINYSGVPIPEAQGKTAPGTVGPRHVWEKSPGISGMAFYDGDRFKAWQHNLFIGALASQELIRLQFDGDKVGHEERLLGELKERIRDVRQGPDGYLYVLTDEDKGRLYKLGLE